MSDNIGRDLLASYIDRILRLKEEQDGISADIKDIYAEAKANGYDKTALGLVVSHLRKKQKAPEKVAEQGELFDLYLTAYEGAGGSHAYARVREGGE